MNTKDKLLHIINEGATRAKFRWLHRSHPELWSEILQLTIFLPGNSSAPQRVWHIINDVYTMPVCPITGAITKWADFDRGYCVTSDRKAKTILSHSRGDYKNCYTDEINKKRAAGNVKAVERGRKYRDKSTYTKESIEKSKQTCIERYGVDNYRKTKEMRVLVSKLIYQRNIDAGCVPRELREKRQLYYDEVVRYTKVNYYEHYYNINPNNLKRSRNIHLDHVYSIHEGFLNNVSPKIIGHWTNLRLINARENIIKGIKSDKTLTQLLEDYNQYKKG